MAKSRENIRRLRRLRRLLRRHQGTEASRHQAEKAKSINGEEQRKHLQITQIFKKTSRHRGEMANPRMGAIWMRIIRIPLSICVFGGRSSFMKAIDKKSAIAHSARTTRIRSLSVAPFFKSESSADNKWNANKIKKK